MGTPSKRRGTEKRIEPTLEAGMEERPELTLETGSPERPRRGRILLGKKDKRPFDE